ncbi:MAG: META domain-containing protein [Hyphomicrobium sp.]
MPKTFLILALAIGLSLADAAWADEPATDKGLGGTSWQLVEFAGGDDTKIKPDDGSKYTLQFESDGNVVARIDCNRGRGTWESKDANQLTFGPMATTRAMCPPGSMHDRILKDLPYVRSYVLKDGHLFFALMADAGIYEFEPTAPTAK